MSRLQVTLISFREIYDQMNTINLKKTYPANCSCLDDPLKNNWAAFKEVDLEEDLTSGRFGDVWARICPTCKYIWLRYFVTYEAFEKSGRWYLGRLRIKDPVAIQLKKVVMLLEDSDPCFYGGSYYDTTGRILENPKGNISVDL